MALIKVNFFFSFGVSLSVLQIISCVDGSATTYFIFVYNLVDFVCLFCTQQSAVSTTL